MGSDTNGLLNEIPDLPLQPRNQCQPRMQEHVLAEIRPDMMLAML